MIPDPTYPPAEAGTIVVWGYLAARPYGGMTWQVLHHLAGFRRLGFDVWYVEDSDIPLQHPETWWVTGDHTANVAYADHWMRAIGLEDRWIVRPPGKREEITNAGAMTLRSLYATADAVFNVCGSHILRDEHDAIDCLVLLETDPVLYQVGVALGSGELIRELERYAFLFTYAENLGNADSRVPVEHFEWLPTRPPVCVDWWTTTEPPPIDAALTTVGNWHNAEKDLDWDGETYHWQKSREFERVMTLPSDSEMPLELALVGIDDTEAQTLRNAGWSILSAQDLSDPLDYRSYIRRSLGEFTAAKGQNVYLRSGWFSDRSACYLAAGRPVITQDTGFGAVLPTGEGLLSFSNEQEAVAAIQSVASGYKRHAQAASNIAHDFFDAHLVLGDVARSIGLL